jgi:hypothetical protein
VVELFKAEVSRSEVIESAQWRPVRRGEGEAKRGRVSKWTWGHVRDGFPVTENKNFSQLCGDFCLLLQLVTK